METTGPGERGHPEHKAQPRAGAGTPTGSDGGGDTNPRLKSQWGDSGRWSECLPLILPELCPSCSQTVQLSKCGPGIFQTSSLLGGPQAFHHGEDCSSAFT